MRRAQNVRNLARNIAFRQNPRTNRIVDVVIDIRNAVGRAHDLPLERLGNSRSRVPEDRHAHLIGKVQPVAVAFEFIHHAKRLLVVVKRRSHHIRQRRLARVTKRRVPQIVPIGRGLGKIFIQPQRAADRPCDPANLERVGHARAVVVSLGREKDLRLVHEPPEGLAVDNPVRVPLVAGAHLVFLRRIEPALRLRRLLRVRRKEHVFLLFESFADGHTLTPSCIR